MKHLLLTTIAAVVLVGCGGPPKDIWEAASKGNIEAVKRHLATGTDVDVKGGWMVITPLHMAALNGHKEIVELLIAKGADINAKDDSEWTPLHWAADEGHKEVAEFLIAEGADVNAKAEDGETPLDATIEFRHPQIADLLRKHGGKTGDELEAEGK